MYMKVTILCWHPQTGSQAMGTICYHLTLFPDSECLLSVVDMGHYIYLYCKTYKNFKA